MSFYVYCIKNIINNKRYIGSRKCNGDPEDDLGIKYFSSSHNKEFMSEQKENPTLFEYEILKIFDNHKDMLEFEIYLHNLYDVGKNINFYNIVKQTSTGFSTSGCKMSKKFEMTDEIRQKISKGVKKYFETHPQWNYLKPKKELKNKCKICGLPTNKKYFCSRECYYISIRNKRRNKCKICGTPTNKKYCCSKNCFNIFIKDKNCDYNKNLSRKRSEYIKENYDKICEINQKILEKFDYSKIGLKISETKRRNNSGNNNARSYGRIIKIFDNNNILQYTIKNGESVNDFCLKVNMPPNIIRSSYQYNTKIRCDEYKGWYCIKELI